jgi:hypothetical protein
VVDDQWLATLAAAVQGELDRVSQTLIGRIRQLAERYAPPTPADRGRGGKTRRQGRDPSGKNEGESMNFDPLAPPWQRHAAADFQDAVSDF